MTSSVSKYNVSKQIETTRQELKDVLKSKKEAAKLAPTVKNLLMENGKDLKATKALLSSVKKLHHTMHKAGFLNKLRAIFVKSFKKDIKETKEQIALVKKEISDLERAQEKLVNIQHTFDKLNGISDRMEARNEAIKANLQGIKGLEDKLAKAKQADKSAIEKEINRTKAMVKGLQGDQARDATRFGTTHAYLVREGFVKK